MVEAIILMLMMVLTGPFLLVTEAATSANRELRHSGSSLSYEERLAHLQGFHEDGYTCWLPDTFHVALCIKDAFNRSVIPATAEDLRNVLFSVNLRVWLLNLLCPPLGEGEIGLASSPQGEHRRETVGLSSPPPPPLLSSPKSDGARRQCIDIVEAALSSSSGDVVAHQRSANNAVARTSATIDEVPWVKAMGDCLKQEYVDNFYPRHCKINYTALAHERGKKQLLPALQNLWMQLMQQREKMEQVVPDNAIPGDSGQSRSGSSLSSMPSWPLASAISRLMFLLQHDTRRRNRGERSEGENFAAAAGATNSASDRPQVQLLAPLAGARIDGEIVPFIANVYLGAALEEQLQAVNDPDDISKSSNNMNGSGGSRHSAVGSSTEGSGVESPPSPSSTPPLTSFHRCEVHAVVDGEVVSRIPVKHNGDDVIATTTTITSTTASAEGEEHETSTRAKGRNGDDGRDRNFEQTLTPKTITYYKVMRGVPPEYHGEPSCSEHPLRAEVLAAGGAADSRGWNGDEDTWLMESRGVDRVCTYDAFGPHRVHGELFCCYSGSMTAGGIDGVRSGSRSSASEKAEVCEVLANSAPVEYHHTGHTADILSGDSWATAGQRGSSSDPGSSLHPGFDSESRSLVGSPLSEPPPEDITVSLHVERAPDEEPVVVSVPRWDSDGEVWEEVFRACSEAFSPHDGILINMVDCIDLAVKAISAKRVDLYNGMVLRMDAYLESVHPDYSLLVEGHTGSCPAKVGALEKMVRDGGDRVNKICEVGFNAGHSSLAWLLNSHPSASVLSFDLGHHPYVETARNFLQAVFPGRLQLVLGNSSVTAPAHASAEEAAGRDPRVCNVVFIDGDHSEEGAYADLVNFSAMTNRSWNAFALDDVDFAEVMAAWRRFSIGGRRGRLESVVQSSTEHYTHVKASGEGRWDVTSSNSVHRIFMERGYLSLGIGHLRVQDN